MTQVIDGEVRVHMDGFFMLGRTSPSALRASTGVGVVLHAYRRFLKCFEPSSSICVQRLTAKSL